MQGKLEQHRQQQYAQLHHAEQGFCEQQHEAVEQQHGEVGGAEGEAEEANLEGRQPTFACQVEPTKR